MCIQHCTILLHDLCTCIYIFIRSYNGLQNILIGLHHFFLSSSLKNGLTALDIAESHAEEKKGYYYKPNFEGVIELLNKHIEETADPPSHHVSI